MELEKLLVGTGLKHKTTSMALEDKPLRQNEKKKKRKKGLPIYVVTDRKLVLFHSFM